MELIIKPTGRCNFNCKFCSAFGMDIQHPSNGRVPTKLKELIIEMKPTMLIITGGEPLMVEPSYYYELHDIAQCSMSATTNLKDFYMNPDKWVELFNEPWFNVSTSFNYGDSRMWDKFTVYDECMFLKVMDLYSTKINRDIPSFIAVIDDNNENTVMDHVYLAKRIGSRVKLNNALAVGKQGKTYQRYKMFHHYLNIIDAGLDKYETNCAERGISRCPRNINLMCENSIRCCSIDSNGDIHISTCDEQLALGNEIPSDQVIHRIIKPEKIPYSEYITEDCSCCELFRLCNGCTSNRMEAKKDPNYCKEMKKLEKRIIDTGWLL